MYFHDCHIHTCFSHDSNSNPFRICENSIKNGVKSVAFTDHFDIEFQIDRDFYSTIAKSAEKAEELNAFYGDKLLVLKGVEFSSPLFDPSIPKFLINSFDFDVVIGSIHSVFSAKEKRPYSHIDLNQYNDEELNDYLLKYFEDVLDLSQKHDFDILAHISCPLRYVKRSVNIDGFKGIIDEILKVIIKKDIAIEVNSKSLQTENTFDFYSLKRYYELGGRKIALGSDSHLEDTVAYKFTETIDVLTEIGFKKACYFVNRNPVYYSL